MPELPEVEHIVRHLGPRLSGRRIARVLLADTRSQRGRESPRGLEGARISAVRRRAKVIIMDVDDDRSLAVHLKLTGKLWLKPKSAPLSKWARLVLDMGRGEVLELEDMRRFGWFRVVGPDEARAIDAAHGPEPLEPSYTFEVFDARRAKRHAPVKPVLLDPKFVAGIGNIYADEILHAARIHPLEPIDGLTKARARQLHASIVSVLDQAVRERKGEPGQQRVGSGSRAAARHFERAVFQRTGEPCPRCGHTITRIVVRGRGTHLCPRCQRLSKKSR